MDDPTTNPDGRVTRTLFSYDVPGPLRPKAARVCPIVFGYEQTVQRNGTSRTYRHPGYLERPGARWVGQSVLLLRPADALELERDPLRLGVPARPAPVPGPPPGAAAPPRAPGVWVRGRFKTCLECVPGAKPGSAGNPYPRHGLSRGRR